MDGTKSDAGLVHFKGGRAGRSELDRGCTGQRSDGVLSQVAVAHAGVVPELLDDAKGKLHFGKQGRFVPVA